jgi:hypothetical protein
MILLGLGPTPPFTSSGAAPAAQAEVQDQGARNHGDLNDRRTDDSLKFGALDRQYAHNYYHQHYNESGFRDRDRLTPEYKARLREGYVIDPDLRNMVLPAPPDLVRGLAPAPSGDRYVVLGGHVCLIDGEYRIQDTIHLEASLGR